MTAPGPGRRGPSRRRWARLPWRVLAGAGVLLAAAGFVDAGVPLALVQAVAPLLGLLGLAVVAGAALARDRWAALAAGLAVAVLLWPVAPRPLATGSPVGGAGAREWRVLAYNTLNGAADPAAIVDAVREHRVDVLVLTEENTLHWGALRHAGLPRLLPYATGVDGFGGTIIATSVPVTCVDVPAGGRCGRVVAVQPWEEVSDLHRTPPSFPLPAVRLPDGTLVRGIHAWSPRMDPPERWRQQQEELIAWRDARPADERLIIAGDANASMSHPVFRRLADGLAHAPRGGFPWTRTWTPGWPIPRFVQIDHILARGFDVADEGVLGLPGSDHGAVWARLVPAGSSRR